MDKCGGLQTIYENQKVNLVLLYAGTYQFEANSDYPGRFQIFNYSFVEKLQRVTGYFIT
jgi:hypothetical protein